MTNVLISGGGIAGLTLGILLKEAGFEPLVVEREPRLRTEGYMMDFFGSGWDVAERMGLVPQLRAIHYPIDALEFVGDRGKPYVSVPIGVRRHAWAPGHPRDPGRGHRRRQLRVLRRRPGTPGGGRRVTDRSQSTDGAMGER
jgi:2-polyprenyl-6-methoxyphenol hydroxylase-like FAD-dependent oxidoreductase